MHTHTHTGKHWDYSKTQNYKRYLPSFDMIIMKSSISVRQDDVDEYFSAYTCECIVWSRKPNKKTRQPDKYTSDKSTILVACKFPFALST